MSGVRLDFGNNLIGSGDMEGGVIGIAARDNG